MDEVSTINNDPVGPISVTLNAATDADGETGIELLFDYGGFKKAEETRRAEQVEASADELVPEEDTPMKKVRAPRGGYRKYTEDQVQKLFDLIRMTAKAAALEVGINIRTAQNYRKQYMEDPEQRLPGIEKKNATGSGAPKLGDEHSDFLVKYFDEHPAATLKVAKDALCEQFEGLTITQSGEKMLPYLEEIGTTTCRPGLSTGYCSSGNQGFGVACNAKLRLCP
ncbi:unnamed protein product [Absidia cylindrospora]